MKTTNRNLWTPLNIQSWLKVMRRSYYPLLNPMIKNVSNRLNLIRLKIWVTEICLNSIFCWNRFVFLDQIHLKSIRSLFSLFKIKMKNELSVYLDNNRTEKTLSIFVSLSRDRELYLLRIPLRSKPQFVEVEFQLVENPAPGGIRTHDLRVWCVIHCRELLHSQPNPALSLQPDSAKFTSWFIE